MDWAGTHGFKASSLKALSSHPRALAARRATPRREFSAASRGPSPGPQPTPEFFPCSLAPAAADMSSIAESMALGAGDEVVSAALGAEAVGKKLASMISSPGVVQPRCASRGALLASISANTTDQPWPPVRCSCRPCKRQQSLRSRHLIDRLRGHAEQEIAAERGIMASGSEETTRSKRRSRMLRERELGRWCKTSPQMLSDPKSLLHVPSNHSLQR